jgi:hypothetical protein
MCEIVIVVRPIGIITAACSVGGGSNDNGRVHNSTNARGRRGRAHLLVHVADAAHVNAAGMASGLHGRGLHGRRVGHHGL